MNSQACCLPVAFALMSILGFAAAGDEKETQPELPKPPCGFQWQWCKDVKVGLLKPQGWHFKEQKKNATRGYFITKEEIEKDGEFRTGLSLNVIPEVGKKKGGKASEFAVTFVRESIRDRKSVLQVIRPRKAGPATTVGCRIKRDGSVIHYFLIADDDRDKLYLFYFESPEEDWEVSWKIGETLFKKPVIDFPETKDQPEK